MDHSNDPHNGRADVNYNVSCLSVQYVCSTCAGGVLEVCWRCPEQRLSWLPSVLSSLRQTHTLLFTHSRPRTCTYARARALSCKRWLTTVAIITEPANATNSLSISLPPPLLHQTQLLRQFLCAFWKDMPRVPSVYQQ